MRVFVCFLILEVFVSARHTTPKDPHRSVNLALETVLEFGNKDNSADLQFLDNVQRFITKVRTVIDNNKNSRRDFRAQKTDLFTAFIQQLISIVNNYEDSLFREFFDVLDDEIRKYHYRGCKFYELIENIEIRKLFATKLDQIKRKPVPAIKTKINILSVRLKNDLYSKNVKDLLEYINSLYRQESKQKFERVLTNLENLNKSKRKRTSPDLVNIIRDGVRDLIFDHYTELNPNARRELISKIETFIKQSNSTANNATDATGIEKKAKLKEEKVGYFNPVLKRLDKRFEMKTEEDLEDDDKSDAKKSDFSKPNSNNMMRNGMGSELGNDEKNLKHTRLEVNTLVTDSPVPTERANQETETANSKELFDNLKTFTSDNEIITGESYDDKSQSYEEETPRIPYQTLYTEVIKFQKSTTPRDDGNIVYRHSNTKLPYVTLWVEESTGGIPKSMQNRYTTAKTKHKPKHWVAHEVKHSKHSSKHNNSYKRHHGRHGNRHDRHRDDRSHERTYNRPKERKHKRNFKHLKALRQREDEEVEKSNIEYYKRQDERYRKRSTTQSDKTINERAKRIDVPYDRPVKTHGRHRNRYAKYDRVDSNNRKDGKEIVEQNVFLEIKPIEVEHDGLKKDNFAVTPINRAVEDGSTAMVVPVRTTTSASVSTTESMIWSPPIKHSRPLRMLPVNNLRFMNRKFGYVHPNTDLPKETRKETKRSHKKSRKYYNDTDMDENVEENVFRKLKDIEDELNVVKSKIGEVRAVKHKKHKHHERKDKKGKSKKHKKSHKHKSKVNHRKHFTKEDSKKDKYYPLEENIWDSDDNPQLIHLRASTEENYAPEGIMEKIRKALPKKDVLISTVTDKGEDIMTYLPTKLAKRDEYNYYNSVTKKIPPTVRKNTKNLITFRGAEIDHGYYENKNIEQVNAKIRNKDFGRNTSVKINTGLDKIIKKEEHVPGKKDSNKLHDPKEYNLKEVKPKLIEEDKRSDHDQQQDSDHYQDVDVWKGVLKSSTKLVPAKTTISTTDKSTATPTTNNTKSNTNATTKTSIETTTTRPELFIPVSIPSRTPAVTTSKPITDAKDFKNDIFLPVMSGMQNIPPKFPQRTELVSTNNSTILTSNQTNLRTAIEDVNKDVTTKVLEKDDQNKNETEKIKYPFYSSDNDIDGPMPPLNFTGDINERRLMYGDPFKDMDVDIIM